LDARKIAKVTHVEVGVINQPKVGENIKIKKTKNARESGEK